RSGFREQVRGERQHVLPASAAAQDEREQLGVGQRSDAVGESAFLWPLADGEGSQAVALGGRGWKAAGGDARARRAGVDLARGESAFGREEVHDRWRCGEDLIGDVDKVGGSWSAHHLQLLENPDQKKPPGEGRRKKEPGEGTRRVAQAWAEPASR